MKKNASPKTMGAVRPDSGQRGVTLIMVLLILVVVSLLGVGGAQIAMMSERGARNDRDMQIAWQSAEAGLIDAEIDMWSSSTVNSRKSYFDGKNKAAFPDSGCGSAADHFKGMCAAVVSGKPAWLRVNFETTSSAAESTAFGTFTDRTFAAGGTGVQPAQAPRYIIEPILVQSGDKANPEPEVVYRITAMGFGPRTDIQAVVQMLYRI